MCSSNFLEVDNSDFSRTLEILFQEAKKNSEKCPINRVRGKYRVFSDLDEALECLKRGHTLFVQIGDRFLNVNFGRKPLDISEYKRINCLGYKKALEALSMEGII